MSMLRAVANMLDSYGLVTYYASYAGGCRQGVSLTCGLAAIVWPGYGCVQHHHCAALVIEPRGILVFEVICCSVLLFLVFKSVVACIMLMAANYVGSFLCLLTH